VHKPRKVVLFVLCCASLVFGSGLSESFAVTKGDWVAWQLGERVRLANETSDKLPPTLAHFDRAKDIVVAQCYGQRPGVEGAREMILRMQTLINGELAADMKLYYGISTQSSDFEIIYYNRDAKGGPGEVARMTKDQIVLPASSPTPKSGKVGL
jgi:hypothetical protein